MSLSSVLLTGFLIFLSALESGSSDVDPVSCETRGSDLELDDVVVLCPPGCRRTRMSVFGTGPYAAVSSVCGAALHRGALGPSGGPVRVLKQRGQHSYVSSYANGIQSLGLSRWTSSFSLSESIHPPLEFIAETRTTSLPAGAQPAKKALKKPSLVKKVLAGGNKDCQMDVAVVMDSSRNIGQRRFNLQKNFVAKLAAMLRVGASGPRVGLIQASDSPKTEFVLSSYTQPKDLLFAIKELTFLGGDSNTGKAILHTAETFFTQENGMRRGHPRVMVVMIDGWPSDDVEQAAILARESGINVFLVSVAKPAAEELSMVADRDFMKKAVCKDNGFFSYSIPSWFSTTKHARSVTQRLCSLDSLLCSKTCYNSVNIGFLIDGSSSVGMDNFKMVLDFLAGIAQSFDISDIGSRVGAVQFTYDQRMEFGLFDHSTKEDTMNALRGISYMSGGTSTGSAISYATQNLFRHPRRGHDFLVVVTDGQSYDDIRGPAMAAQRQGITIFSVGVAWAPLDDLRAMSSEPKDRHTLFTREFTGLLDFIPLVVRSICQDFTEISEIRP
ncbi:cochlin isoform X2 [Oryzias latipes]|uniref:cochlin isoform X2 n=1 Tax=Oryzias latipes TaxID=8090 RepID=UPI0005CB85AB|nr:cochlin isoform X2 [Oryzias latipes]